MLLCVCFLMRAPGSCKTFKCVFISPVNLLIWYVSLILRPCWKKKKKEDKGKNLCTLPYVDIHLSSCIPTWSPQRAWEQRHLNGSEHTCPQASVAPTVKNMPAVQEIWVDPWVRKIPWRGEWLPTPVFLLEHPMDRGAWQATVHGVIKSQTRLSNENFHFSHTGTQILVPKDHIFLYWRNYCRNDHFQGSDREHTRCAENNWLCQRRKKHLQKDGASGAGVWTHLNHFKDSHRLNLGPWDSWVITLWLD